MDVHKRLDKVRRVIDNLVERANEDGIITPEEASMLRVAEENLEAYEQMVEQALEDGIITQDEKNQLIDLEEKLLSDSYFTAVEDEHLDDDELLLLKTLILTMDPKASLSWLADDIDAKKDEK